MRHRFEGSNGMGGRGVRGKEERWRSVAESEKGEKYARFLFRGRRVCVSYRYPPVGKCECAEMRPIW